MKEILDKLRQCEGFDWDEGNSDKNWEKHKVSRLESEQVFFNDPFVVYMDEKHSQKEARYLVMGVTNKGRTLTLILTLRMNKLIRVISARDMSKNERRAYGKIEKESP